MKHMAVLASLVLLLPSAAAAQTVDEIVAKHIAARGGYDKLKAIQTIKMTRTVATPFSNLTVIVYKRRPGLFRLEQTAAGQPTVLRGITPDAAWNTTPDGKVNQQPPPAAAELRDLEGDFDGPLVDWKEKGHTVTLEGTEALPGGPAYKLKVTLKSGLERFIYLDAKTYLDRRHTGLQSAASPNKVNVVIDFGGWKSVGGIMFPFDISEERTSRQPVTTLETYTKAIELNVPIDAGVFAMPAAAPPKGQ